MDAVILVALLLLIGSTLNALFLQLAFDVYQSIARRGRERAEKSMDAPHYMRREEQAARAQVSVTAHAEVATIATGGEPLIPGPATDVELDRPYRASQADRPADETVSEPSFAAEYITAAGAFFVYLLVFAGSALALQTIAPNIVGLHMTAPRVIAHLSILFAAFSLTIFYFRFVLKIKSLRTAYLITLNYYLIVIAVALLVYACRPILM